jgi:N-methylhydantoinase B
MDPSVLGMMYGMYFMASDPTVTLNAGLLDGLTSVHRRPGSLLSPEFPAALGMRGITWIHANSAVFGTLAVASQGHSRRHQHPTWSITCVVGIPDTGEMVFLMDGLGVGYGARPWADGHDGVYYIAQKNFPVEFLELQWPIRLLGYGLAADSGGPGLHRGGMGVIRRVQVLVDGLVFASRVNNVRYPCWGVNGGMEGGPGRVVLHPGSQGEKVLPPICDGVELKAGDIVEVRTAGGGGWGDPRLRPPERVVSDVRAGFVSTDQARDCYGVVLRDDERNIDEVATSVLRESMPDPTGLFHQSGRYFDIGEGSSSENASAGGGF